MLAPASLAWAQATRTWVSGFGDDANPCSRTAPCKTFAGTISKTAAGGEINAIDPGGYGTVTITKAITIDGGGTLAGVLNALSNGIIVHAGVNDIVILRNIDIDGAGTGINGIRYDSAGELVVENVDIYGTSAAQTDPNGSGILVNIAAPSVTGKLVVRNSRIVGGRRGVFIQGAAGTTANVLLDGVTIVGPLVGVDAGVGFAPGFGFGSSTTIVKSLITQTSVLGAQVQAGDMNVENSTFSYNPIAVQAQPGATMRISNNGFFGNPTAFGCGGTLASTGDNRKAGSIGGCNPNAVITFE